MISLETSILYPTSSTVVFGGVSGHWSLSLEMPSSSSSGSSTLQEQKITDEQNLISAFNSDYLVFWDFQFVQKRKMSQIILKLFKSKFHISWFNNSVLKMSKLLNNNL